MTEGGTSGRGSGIIGGGGSAGSGTGICTIGGGGAEATLIATGGGGADIEPDDDGAMDLLSPASERKPLAPTFTGTNCIRGSSFFLDDSDLKRPLLFPNMPFDFCGMSFEKLAVSKAVVWGKLTTAL